MAEQLLPCPGCGGEPFVDQPEDEPRWLECNECTFRARDRDWNRRTPGPATKAMLESLGQHLTDLQELDPSLDLSNLGNPYLIAVKAFLVEWGFPCVVVLRPDPATPSAPEQSQSSSPWKCCVCGQPVRIGDDLRPYHLGGPAVHEAEQSDADLKILADGLRMSD